MHYLQIRHANAMDCSDVTLDPIHSGRDREYCPEMENMHRLPDNGDFLLLGNPEDEVASTETMRKGRAELPEMIDALQDNLWVDFAERLTQSLRVPGKHARDIQNEGFCETNRQTDTMGL